MGTGRWLGALVLAGILGGCVHTHSQAAPPRARVEVAFYDDLSPYGEWFRVPGYGWVWRPYDAEPGFVPYSTGGYWAYSDDGWMFVSDYAWGGVPFHYGRWMYLSRAGWVWVPGTVWAPAWVYWRAGGGYVGWAPMPPPGVQVQMSWVFVDSGYLGRRDLYYHRLDPRRSAWAYHAATPVRSARGPEAGSGRGGSGWDRDDRTPGGRENGASGRAWTPGHEDAGRGRDWTPPNSGGEDRSRGRDWTPGNAGGEDRARGRDRTPGNARGEDRSRGRDWTPGSSEGPRERPAPNRSGSPRHGRSR